MLHSQLPRSEYGLAVGQLAGKKFIPDHALAMNAEVKSSFPFIQLDKETSLLYLKGETRLPKPSTLGWHLVRYQNLNLGWVKVLPNRINNYYPKHYRIRMNLK